VVKKRDLCKRVSSLLKTSSLSGIDNSPWNNGHHNLLFSGIPCIVHTKVELKRCIVPTWVHLAMPRTLQSGSRTCDRPWWARTSPTVYGCGGYLRLNIGNFPSQSTGFAGNCRSQRSTRQLYWLLHPFGTTIDPLRIWIKHHAPVHEQVLFTEESWKRSIYIHGCGLQYNHEHAMTGPIVGHGQLMEWCICHAQVAILLLMPKILQISVPCVLTYRRKERCYVFAQSDLHQNGQLDWRHGSYKLRLVAGWRIRLG